jgi:hypothetical protein
MEDPMKTGGCFCKSVRYELKNNDYKVVNCHCSMCRRTSGAPFVSWLIVPTTDFRYTGDTPQLLKSSENASRDFCAKCGTPVTCVNETHPEIVDVTLGSLDEPETFVPSGDFYTDTRLPWVT